MVDYGGGFRPDRLGAGREGDISDSQEGDWRNGKAMSEEGWMSIEEVRFQLIREMFEEFPELPAVRG